MRARTRERAICCAAWRPCKIGLKLHNGWERIAIRVIEPITKTVYVVDDEAVVRRSLALLLRHSAYFVHPFSNGDDFLEALPYLKAGCVLLDIHMPGVDGLTVQERLRRDRPDLPIVFVTAYGDVPTVVQAMRGGAFSVIEKPFDNRQVLEVLDQVFDELPSRVESASARERAVAQIGLLSPREREVLAGLLAGLPNKVIAGQLELGLRTVETHRANAARKLGLRGVGEMVQLAMEAGLKPLQ